MCIQKILSYTFNYAIDLKFSTCIYKTRTNGQVKPPLKMDDWCTKLFAHDSTDKIVFRSLLNTTIARLLLPTVPMKGFFWQKIMILDDFTEALGVFYTNLRVQIYSQQKGYRRGQSAKTVYTLLSQHNNRVLHVFGKSTISITSFADYRLYR